MDLFDGFVLAGVVLIAFAVGLAWGWLAVLAYVGTVLIVAGLVGAMSRVRG